jgi:hypothetical protein
MNQVGKGGKALFYITAGLKSSLKVYIIELKKEHSNNFKPCDNNIIILYLINLNIYEIRLYTNTNDKFMG